MLWVVVVAGVLVGVSVIGGLGTWAYIRYTVKRYHAGKPSIWYSSFRPFQSTQPTDINLPVDVGSVFQRSYIEHDPSIRAEDTPIIKILY